MRAWDLAARTPWAITEESLRQILAIAARDNPDPQTVAAELGYELENTRAVTVRDGVAIIPISGPLFRYANLFTRISGATSYQELATDFHAALEDPSIHAILLNVDTPGGEVKGCFETAQMIFAAREKKPVWAYVDGWAASAGYALASAAERVISADTGLTGSIGVISVYHDYSEAQKKAGIREIEILSSQSPKKSPNPAEEEGRSQIQVTLDDLCAVFIGYVAKHRGVSEQTVLEDFGKGDIMIAEKAITAGLVDEISSFESVVAELASRRTAPARGIHANMEHTMEDKTTAPAAEAQPAQQEITAESLRASHPALVMSIETGAATKERERIFGIEELSIEGSEEVIAECRKDPNCSVDQAAVKVIQATRKRDEEVAAKRRDHIRAMAEDEDELEPPAASTSEEEGDPDQAAANRILSAGRRTKASA